MLKYMLDTNIIIYTLKNHPQSVRDKFNVHRGEFCMSSITLMELIYGLEKSKQSPPKRALAEAFISAVPAIDYGEAAAEHTGDIRAMLEKSGTPIGNFDNLIAGHARSMGMVLITNNTKEFKRVDGLRLENWVMRQ